MSCNEPPYDALSCNALSWERLVSYVDDELSGGDRDDVERHVNACAHCTHEADLLRRSGALIAGLPGLDPGDEFAGRVLAQVAAGAEVADVAEGGERSDEPVAAAELKRRGSIRSMWPLATAAAAVLVTALAARVWWPGASDADGILSASEEQEIAADLYILANLDVLEASEADELISLVENLDLLEGTETEISGLFGDVDDEESTEEGG